MTYMGRTLRSKVEKWLWLFNERFAPSNLPEHNLEVESYSIWALLVDLEGYCTAESEPKKASGGVSSLGHVNRLGRRE